MERIPNPESREAFIERRIIEIAEVEGIDAEIVFSDLATFAEILETDRDAEFYFEELAEKIGISAEELIKYAKE